VNAEPRESEISECAKLEIAGGLAGNRRSRKFGGGAASGVRARSGAGDASVES